MEISKPAKLIVGIILIALGFGVGVSYQKKKAEGSIATPATEVNFGLFWDAWNVVQDKYVDKSKLNTQTMVYGAIDGMVNSLGDPYTVFFSPKDSAAFADEIKGAFGGVGIEIGLKDQVLTVIAPIKDSPAERAGMLAGDKILKIDDKSTNGLGVSEAVALIRGPRGTTVTLTISQEGQKEEKVIKLVRATIKIPAVTWKLQDNSIAVLQIFTFNQNADSEFKKAAEEISKSKADRIILDLRNNPGGLLDSAVNIAGFFQENQKLVVTERYGDGKEDPFYSSGNPILKKYPLVILLNKGSASASEILAGALHDNRHVLIVGETSFGKGSVQEINGLTGGSSLKVTIAKWYTPSGLSIDQNGIKPDIEVKLTDEDIKAKKDPQLDRAIQIIRGL